MKAFCYTLAILAVISAFSCKNSESRYNDQYILTPKPSQRPKINGPKVFGVHPGNPVIFTIPVTGKRPITYRAEGLPEGLSLDRESGRFSGYLKDTGTHHIKIHVRNNLGKDERDFRIIAGEKLALTPPMGWNSWNGWGDLVTDENVRTTAKAMVETDLINHGWSYVNIDIGWQNSRGGKYNAIQGNERFPDMKALADYVHSLGLKIGIYSSPWIRGYFGYQGGSSENADGSIPYIPIGREVNSDRYIGKYKFDMMDVKQWEEWEFDYLKYDGVTSQAMPDSLDDLKYMSRALRKCRRDFIYSVVGGVRMDNYKEKIPYVQLWRTGHDIRDVWDKSLLTKDTWAQGLVNIWESHPKWQVATAPGAWADPDMLVVGWVGFGDTILHKTLLTPDELYTHISLWCLWSAPLFIGSPVEKLDAFTISLLSNDEVLEVDQDPLGIQALRAYKNGDAEAWSKNMEDGSVAVGLFNRSDSLLRIEVPWYSLGLSGKQRVRDLWRQKNLGTFEDRFTAEIRSHGVVLLRIFPKVKTNRK
jgi:alpha-galactosidase